MFVRHFHSPFGHISIILLLCSTFSRVVSAQEITAAPDGNPYNIPDEYRTLSGISEVAIPAEAVFRRWEPSLSSFCSLTQLKSYADFLAQYTTINDEWLHRSQKPPCCGPCRVGAHEAQLVYWPDKLEGGTAVVDGITYTYPQNQIIVKGVKAANLCGLLGTTVDRADLPILGDFSTVVNRVEYDSRPGRLPTRTGPYTTTMNWDDLRDCENNTGYDPTTVTSFGSEGQTTLMWSDRCNPSIEIPNNVYDIQSEWNTCSGWLVDGVPDPPVALHTAGVIKPPVDPSPTSNAPIQSPPAQPADPPPTIAPTPTPAPPAPDPVPAPAPAPKPATQTSNPPSANPPKPSTQPEKPGNTAAPADNPVKSSSAPAPSAPKPNTRKVLGQTAVVLPSNAGIVVGTHTLHAGAPAVTIHGTLVSAADNNVLVVDNKSRTTLAPADPTGVIVGGQLLTPGGPAVTVSGTVISLGSSALIIGSSTTSFVPTSSAGGKTSVGIGEVILSELGWIVTAVAPVTSGSVTSPTATKNVDDPTILTGSSVRIRTRWGHIASAWMSFGILWWALG